MRAAVHNCVIRPARYINAVTLTLTFNLHYIILGPTLNMRPEAHRAAYFWAKTPKFFSDTNIILPLDAGKLIGTKWLVD